MAEKRESQAAKAQRYGEAMRRVARMPDSEAWWPMARTMLAYVLHGDSVDDAQREAAAIYGLDADAWLDGGTDGG